MQIREGHFRLNPDERRFLNTELKGLAFELEHISYRPKNLLHCLTDKPVSQLFFSENLKDGSTREVSVKAYYDEKYRDFFEKFGSQVCGHLPAVQVSLVSA